MATSTITGTITDPTGVAVAGVVVTCRLMPLGGFRSADGSEVARLAAATTNASGVYTFVLERNSGITPANTYYELTEAIPVANGGTKVWTISVGASNQTVLAALVTPLAAQTAVYLTQDAADARYQALGSLGAGVPATTSLDGLATGTAGVSTAASRDDHDHVVQNDAWTSYTPTLTQSATVTKTTNYARYQRTGRMITVQLFLTVTGAGTAANGVLIGLPVAANAAASGFPVTLGAGGIFDSSAASFYKGTVIFFNATTVQMRATNTTSAGVLGVDAFTAALAVGDQIDLTVTYEAAT